MKRLTVGLLIAHNVIAQAAYVRSVKGPATGHGTNATASIDCHDGNFVGVIVTDYLQPVNGTLTSSPSNTFLSKPTYTDGGNSNIRAFWAENANVSSSMTLTYSGGNYPTLVGVCASGVLASGSQDQYSQATAPQFGGTGSVTTTVNGELIIPAASSDETTGTFGGWYVANVSTLNGAISNSQTSITVTSGAFFPNASVIQCEDEQMLVGSGGGTTNLTVTRGYNSSVAVAHNNAIAVGVLDSTFPVIQHQQVIPATSDAIAVAVQNQSTAATINPHWTGMYSGPILVITFKPAPAPSSSSPSISAAGIVPGGIIH